MYYARILSKSRWMDAGQHYLFIGNYTNKKEAPK
jgi:hypothetical protein